MKREFAISEAANVAFNISQETGEQARKGNQVLDSTVKAMNELTKQMGNASEGIKDLDEQSQKVADLVKVLAELPTKLIYWRLTQLLKLHVQAIKVEDLL